MTINNMLKTNNLKLKIVDQLLFQDVNISLDSKRRKKVGLVGKNGGGKSSLLKILTGELKPTAGDFLIGDEQIGYFPQEWKLPEKQLVGIFLEQKLNELWEEYKIDKALSQVGLSEDYLYKDIKNLSGGEKVKIYFAGLLLDDPSILLLDEPTNNLDEKGVLWLEEFIRNFNGSIIVVSHDRYLLNQSINEIWEINPITKNIDVFGGNYDDFLIEKERLQEKQLVNFNRDEREIIETQKWIKMHPELKFTDIMAKKKAKLERIKTNQVEKPELSKKIKMEKLKSEKRGLVLKVQIKNKSWNKKTVLENLDFKMHKNETVLISGKNGSGKTTLLNIITGIDQDFDGEVVWGENVNFGFLRQFSELNKNNSILQEMLDKTSLIEEKARAVLARLWFDAEKVNSKVGVLSFGQLKRLDLAIILAQKPNILILDEPTNHLDIYTREELESFIVDQNIPMIIVSHDRYFVEKIGFDKEITVG